jgi:hypothetical protein
MRRRMKLHLSNLGPIKYGEIELGDITHLLYKISNPNIAGCNYAS